MAQVTITINAREYAVACEDGQELRIMQLARILDDKAKMLTQGGQQVNENMLLAMVGLLVADELSELKKNNPEAAKASAAAAEEEKNAKLYEQTLKLLQNAEEQIKTIANKIELL